MTAVLENNSRLLFIEVNIFLTFSYVAVCRISQTSDVFAADDGFVDYFFAIFGVNFDIQPALRLDANQRSHFAEAVAAAFFQTDRRLVRFLFQLDAAWYAAFLEQLFKTFKNLKRTAGHTACAGANENSALFGFNRVAVYTVHLLQFFSIFKHQRSPFSVP